MGYSISEAKDLVIRAGKMLVESGLIARTWGNISARISDTQFVITPSGLAYETLTPEQIVIVNIADCSYEGQIKPSSEKGIHADAYRLRSEVNFIIHTHQLKASVISIDGTNLKVSREEYQNIIGDSVPCAAYGMPSTGKLRKAVAQSVSDYSKSKAVLMKCHGTVCMGTSLENSFEIARTLENIAEEKYQEVCGKSKPIASSIPDYGSSERIGDSFILNCNNKSYEYKISNLSESAPKVAILHAAIYKNSNVNNIIHSTEAEVVEASRTGQILRPYLDDLAQIAGINITIVNNCLKNTKDVAKKLKSKNAVLLENEGALCTGITKDDAIAVGMVLKKGCVAHLYSIAIHNTKWLSKIDAELQRIIYVKKYSKQKK
jgi:L-fuculose-phosphate aldolase